MPLEKADTLRVAPLSCTQCGATQPLADGDAFPCAHCGAPVPVPPNYQATRAYGHEAKRVRREAEKLYRSTLHAAFPKWAPKAWGFIGWPAIVIVVPVFFWLTSDYVAWHGSTLIVFGMLSPAVIGGCVLAYVKVGTEPFIYLRALGGKLRPGTPTATGEPTCGVCAAQLTVEPDALAATCDYCFADSWLEGVPETHQHTTDAKRANLHDLLAAKSFQSFDQKLLIAVTSFVLGGLWLAARLAGC